MKFRDLLTYVQPEVPGCPAFQIEKAVREAAITLFSKADIYRAEPEMLLVVAGVNEYDLTGPTGTEPSRVLDLQYQGRPLTKVADERDIYSIIDSNGPSRPTHYYQRDNETLILAPTPAEAVEFRLFMSLKPNATSTSIPDGIGKEYRHLLACGAKSYLMLMGAQPWSNPQLGVANKALFDRGVSGAIRRATFGNSGAPLTVKKRNFI